MTSASARSIARWISLSAVAATLMSLALSLSACSGQQVADESVRETSQPGLRLAVRWQMHLGDNSVLDLRPSEFGGAEISPNGRSLAIVTQAGDIALIEAASGEILWSIQSGDKLSSKPAIDHNFIYVASHSGFVTAYSLTTGEEQWRTEIGTMLNGSPQLVDDELYVSGASEALIVLDRSSGDEKWRHANERFTELNLRGGPTPLVTEDFVYVGYSDGTLHKLTRGGGETVWTADLAGDVEELRDVDSAPLLIDGVVYALSFSGGVHALDAETGAEVWHNDLTGADRLLPLPGKRLVTVSSNDRVVWIDAESGVELYDLELVGNGFGGPTPLTEEFMAVFDSSRGLRIVNTERPYIHTEFIPGGGIDSEPVVSGQSMYLVTNHGYIYALDMHRL